MEMDKENFGWRYIFRLALYKRRLVWRIFLFTLLVYVAGACVPIFTQMAIDNIISGAATVPLIIIGASAVVAMLLEAKITYVRQTDTIELGAFLDRRLSLMFLLRQLTNQGVARNIDIGDQTNRFQNITTIRDAILIFMPQAIFDGGFAIIALSIVFYYDLTIGLAVVFTSILFSLYIKKRSARLHSFSYEHFGNESDRISNLNETMFNMKTVKLAGLEYSRFKKFSGHTTDSLRSLRGLSELTRTFSVGSQIAGKSITLIVIAIGCVKLIVGSMTIGELLAIQLLVGRVTNPILMAGTTISHYEQVNVAIREIGKFFSAPRERKGIKTVLQSTKSPTVYLDALSFKYSDVGDYVLKNISLSLPQKGVYCIVGKNGSGKSTLLSIILGLEDRYEGKCEMFGRPLSDYNPRWLRKRFSVVSQEAALFKGTIRENLLPNDRKVEDRELIECLESVGLDRLAGEASQTLDQELEDSGRNLSGGQRQRLSVARALMEDKDVYIFDEPTAFLDAEGANQLEKRLLEIGKNKLLILVTHRMPIMKMVDNLIVLDKGALVGFGHHDKLITVCPPYQNLWSNHREMSDETYTPNACGALEV